MWLFIHNSLSKETPRYSYLGAFCKEVLEIFTVKDTCSLFEFGQISINFVLSVVIVKLFNLHQVTVLRVTDY